MALLVQGARLTPSPMAKDGGKVTFVFEARSAGGKTAMKASYSIPLEFPYEFVNPSDPAVPLRVVTGQPSKVTEDPRDYAELLVLQKVKGEETKNVFVKVEILEVDDSGDTLMESGKLVQPKVLRAVLSLR